MIICLCKGVEYFSMEYKEIKEKFFLFESAKDLDMGVPFRYKGKLYHIACMMPSDNIAIAHEFSLKDEVDDEYGAGNITCPYCGRENNDSWEVSGDDGEEVCDNCGSTFSWTREVSVTYDSCPIKPGEIMEMGSEAIK